MPLFIFVIIYNFIQKKLPILNFKDYFIVGVISFSAIIDQVLMKYLCPNAIVEYSCEKLLARISILILMLFVVCFICENVGIKNILIWGIGYFSISIIIQYYSLVNSKKEKTDEKEDDKKEKTDEKKDEKKEKTDDKKEKTDSI